VRGEHEEPAIDQAAITARLFHETGHFGAFHLQGAVAPRGLNGRDRRLLPSTVVPDGFGSAPRGAEYSFMICQRIGLSPISIMGLGL
jgi:hypothetical protein